MEGQTGNKEVATAASMRRLLPQEHNPLGQKESEASELTRGVGEEEVMPCGVMGDEKRGL